ncbi:MAG: tRNA (guanosine(46)-N7)-methyltransferase TrmB [Thermodesulfobacteriota bacterium]
MDNSEIINPALDISLRILPLDMEEVFGNGNECLLEIGFGDGDFLIENALGSPDKNYVGIEIKKRRFNKAVKRARRQKAANARFIHMDADIALGELFSPNSFSTAYINFPDPWPKDRHKKHRIINRRFLRKLSRVMKKGAFLEIASDHREYVQNTLDTMKSINLFESEFPDPGYMLHIPGRTETTYEKEFRAEGREIHYMRFKNTGLPGSGRRLLR